VAIPVDVHEIDADLMRAAIGRLKEFGPHPAALHREPKVTRASP